MKKWMVVGLLGLSPMLQGCITAANTARTLFVQPSHFADELDRVVTHCRHVRLAREALAMHEGHYSTDFGDGYVDGYARYLDKGGTGLAPAIPPRRYWRAHYRTPEGKQAVEEYFEGWRAGAAAAIASGLRQVDTVATSLPPRTGQASAGWGLAEEPVEEALPRPRQLQP